MEAKQKATETEWEITTERYVAFIDIMGFKDMVARSTHNEIYEMMKKIDAAKKMNETVRWDDAEERHVKSTFYSDSIILYSKDNSLNSAYHINATVSALSNDLLSAGIPHKGALAFGKMTLDDENSIFFGQPLIDAYLLQEELNLYCVVVSSSAEQEFHKQAFIDKSKLIIRNYRCNFKGGSSNHLTIPPLYACLPQDEDESKLKALIDGIKKLRHKTSGHLRKYIDYTEEYIEYVRDRDEIY